MSKKRLTAYFLLYNFIGSAVAIGGWLWEALIYLITEHRFVNRGFFYGPYLPVYGAGAVLLSVIFYQKRIAVIITYAHLNQTDYPQEFYHSRLYARLRRLLDLSRRILDARLQGLPSRRLPHAKLRRLPSQRPLPARLQNQPRLKQRKQIRNSLKRRYQHAAQDIRIFFLSLCGGCLTEFAAGWLLWHVFHRKYWDYSNYPLNLAGYVCVFSAVGFGAFGVIWFKWAGPFLIRTWERTAFSVQILIIGLADLVFVTDLVFSLLQPHSGEFVTFSFLIL